MTITAGSYLKQPVFGRLIETRESGAWWAQLLFFLWFVQNNMTLPGDAVMLYGLTALVMLATALNFRDWLNLAKKAWPLFMIPLLALISFLWADYPSQAIRVGAFFTLSSISVILMVLLLKAAQLIRLMFFASTIGLIFVWPELGVFSQGGVSILGGKNFFAMKMMIGMVCALSVALNSDENIIFRVVAFVFVFVNFYFVTFAQSATALVLSVVAFLSLITMYIFWIKFKNIRGARTTLLYLLFCLGSLGVLAVLSMPSNEFIKTFLDALGKDTTLTGRTSIWVWGEHVANQRPVLGVGAGSFWQYDVGIAQTIVENDHKPPGLALSFHNTYLETRVHLGYVGMIAIISIIAWTLFRNFAQFISEPDIPTATMLLTCLIGFSMSFTESILYGYFHTGIIMFFVGVVYTCLGEGEKLIGAVMLTVDENDNLEILPYQTDASGNEAQSTI